MSRFIIDPSKPRGEIVADAPGDAAFRALQKTLRPARRLRRAKKQIGLVSGIAMRQVGAGPEARASARDAIAIASSLRSQGKSVSAEQKAAEDSGMIILAEAQRIEARSFELQAAFEQGKDVDPFGGTIDGQGSWGTGIIVEDPRIPPLRGRPLKKQ